MRRITAQAVTVSLLVLALAGFLYAASGQTGQAGYRIGMSEAEALNILRQNENDPAAEFIETICEIPLGLDVLGGVTFFTTDTGVTMKKAVGAPPLYFYKGRCIGMRIDLTRMDEFLALKAKYPAGRYIQQTFPREKRATSAFVVDSSGVYAFTNRHTALYIFDDAARKSIAAGVQGSYCWHAKTVSPNLPAFPAAYRRCLAENQSQAQAKRAQDLASCRKYCSETHEFLASPNCAAHCEQAAR